MKHTIYWRDTEPYEVGPPLREDLAVDVCIVGGGYTGLWAAHFLKTADPGLDVAILEADFVGAGASGHNDGFVTPTIGHSLRNVVDRFGPEAAKAGYTAVGRSITELVRFCAKHDLDAEIEPNGFLLVATNAAQTARLAHDVELAARVTGRKLLRVLDGAEVRRRLPTPVPVAAIEGQGALVNPFKLVRGLARVVGEQGVAIHERTPMTGLVPGRGGIGGTGAATVSTPAARVRARHVLCCTNAYQHRLPAFRRHVLPVWSYAAVTEPLTAEQRARAPWPGREGFVEARNFVTFARLTAGDRLLIGGGPARYHAGRDMDEAHSGDARAAAFLRDTLRRFFPQWADVRFEYAYGGPVAMTRHLVPQAGELAPGVHYAHGYCGNGIAVSHTMGKVLRDLVLGRDTPYRRLFFVSDRQPRVPPEPLATAGAALLGSVLALQDRYPAVVRWPTL